MSTFFSILLISILLVGLAWIGIAIKMFVQKDGKFTKTCGSVDPTTGKIVACSCDRQQISDCNNVE